MIRRLVAVMLAGIAFAAVTGALTAGEPDEAPQDAMRLGELLSYQSYFYAPGKRDPMTVRMPTEREKILGYRVIHVHPPSNEAMLDILYEQLRIISLKMLFGRYDEALELARGVIGYVEYLWPPCRPPHKDEFDKVYKEIIAYKNTATWMKSIMGDSENIARRMRTERESGAIQTQVKRQEILEDSSTNLRPPSPSGPEMIIELGSWESEMWLYVNIGEYDKAGVFADTVVDLVDDLWPRPPEQDKDEYYELLGSIVELKKIAIQRKNRKDADFADLKLRIDAIIMIADRPRVIINGYPLAKGDLVPTAECIGELYIEAIERNAITFRFRGTCIKVTIGTTRQVRMCC